MKKFRQLALAVSLFITGSLPALAQSSTESLTLMTTKDADMKALTEIVNDSDLKVMRDIYSTRGHFHIVELQAKKGTLAEGQKKLIAKKSASIRSLEVTPKTKFEATPVVFPNDPNSPLQYSLSVMNFNTALKVLASTGGHQRTNPHITLIDSGIKPFPGEMDQIAQYNFVGGANGIPETPFDSGQHGTAVSSLAASTTNNKTLLAGVGTNRLPVAVTMCRISNDGSTISTFDVLDALTWCIDNQVLRGGPGAVSVSLNSTAPPTYNGSSVIQNLALELRQQGDLMVNGSGNTGTEDPSPEQYLRRVGATDQNNLQASFSTFGPFLAYAPGVSIASLDALTNGIFFVSGTSLSTPNWAGSVAFLQSLNPRLTAPQADSIIFDTATITSQGFHLPNIARAVTRALATH